MRVTSKQLHWILDGIDIDATVRHPVRYNQVAVGNNCCYRDIPFDFRDLIWRVRIFCGSWPEMIWR